MLKHFYMSKWRQSKQCHQKLATLVKTPSRKDDLGGPLWTNWDPNWKEPLYWRPAWKKNNRSWTIPNPGFISQQYQWLEPRNLLHLLLPLPQVKTKMYYPTAPFHSFFCMKTTVTDLGWDYCCCDNQTNSLLLPHLRHLIQHLDYRPRFSVLGQLLHFIVATVLNVFVRNTYKWIQSSCFHLLHFWLIFLLLFCDVAKGSERSLFLVCCWVMWYFGFFRSKYFVTRISRNSV